MMKNRAIVALLSIAMLAGSPARAFTPVTPGASASGAKAWVPPFAAASANTLAGIQAFLGSDNGRRMLQQTPSLQAFLRMSPASEAHLRLTGAMGLAEGLDPQQMAQVLNERFQASEKAIVDTVASRVNELASQVGQDAIGAEELYASALELAPFLEVPGTTEKVRAVLALAGSALADRTMGSAKKIAAMLLPSATEDATTVGTNNPADASNKLLPSKNDDAATTENTVPTPNGKDEKPGSKPIAIGFGIAALFASLTPTVFGLGAFFGPITTGGMALSPVGQAILLAVGVPLLIFGVRVMRANKRSGSSDDSAFPGFLIGMGSIFVELPALRALITGDMSMPVNTLIAAAMMAVTALGSLAIDNAGKRARANAASPWLAFIGYVVGVAAMIVGGKLFGPLAILGGLVLIVAVGFGSLFLGPIWDALKKLFSKAKDSKPDLGFLGRWLPKLGFAPQGITPQAGALIGFLVGIFLSLAFIKVSVAFAMMPIICPVLGYYLASRRGK